MRIRQLIIVDDNQADIDHLTKLVDDLYLFKLAGVASTVEEAIELLLTKPIDLIFLDVRLSNQSGLTLLKIVSPLPSVIITSAYPEYAIESYEIGKVADYLLKPLVQERLQIAVGRALQDEILINGGIKDTFIFLKTGTRIQRFDYEDIDYIEGFGIYAKVYTNEQFSLTGERMAVILKMLPSQYFIRVHKSFIININKITAYDRKNFWVGRVKIPIGGTYRPYLESLFSLNSKLE